MGFCRRCGEIVSGTRCKCGGTAVGTFVLPEQCWLVNSVCTAPVVPWNRSQLEGKTPDRWSKTYIHRERSASPTRPLATNFPDAGPPTPTASPTKRFLHPASNINVDPVLGSRVSAHIASTTSQNRPPSPLKYLSTLPDPDLDILPSLASHDVTLSKVYGSVLQPKESLKKHSCAICSSIFPPDATIYPDPTVTNSSRFLCRPCFTINGGSRGPCYACSRPVLILRSEGGFVEAAEKYWHKRCFNCSNCSKNIGDSPMLDLLGNPSCAECFDNCLKRSSNTPKKRPQRDGKVSNIGGMNFTSSSTRSREGSPAVEELEQRLGIIKSREGSPALEELSQRLSMIGKESSARYSASWSAIGWPLASSANQENSPLAERSRSKRSSQLDESPARKYSPVRGQSTGSPAPTQEAIEEMKQRFLTESPYPSSPRTPTSARRADPLLDAPATQLSPIIPPTPDLISDFSDTTTQSSSSGPGSPPRNNELFNELFCTPGLEHDSHSVPHGVFAPLERLAEERAHSPMKSPMPTPKSYEHTPSSPSKASTSTPGAPRYPFVEPETLQFLDKLIPPPTALATATFCADCGSNLFSARGGGSYVSVPNEGSNAQALMYHTDCFKCVECHGVFKPGNTGQTIFVTSKSGPCHVEVSYWLESGKSYTCVSYQCAPPTKITFRKSPSLSSLKSSPSHETMKSAPHAAALPPTSPAYASSSRLESQPLVALTSAVTSVPRFGSRTTCPGCHQSVSLMERGVVPGPQGTRWHTRCLVCGGKSGVKRTFGQVKEKKNGTPGCGKRLDSAAKSGKDGGVWCRECLVRSFFFMLKIPCFLILRSSYLERPELIHPKYRRYLLILAWPKSPPRLLEPQPLHGNLPEWAAIQVFCGKCQEEV